MLAKGQVYPSNDKSGGTQLLSELVMQMQWLFNTPLMNQLGRPIIWHSLANPDLSCHEISDKELYHLPSPFTSAVEAENGEEVRCHSSTPLYEGK
ncbi:hypothetical protein B296_00054532 [Ensete ventricosum]|uniref:Uncharacterized protein n=1 Tax=Ensete ventricosum TaxID=4639 RepID=A0A426X0X1_ENSVE|nr:hypothetical protein B296_00054532 [Ensete ventricosum]